MPSIRPNDPNTSPALPMVHLTLEARRMVVVPPPHLGVPEFVLPMWQKYRIDWLATACGHYLSSQGRCIAFLLFLDQRTGRWNWALPHQRASRDSACWTVSKGDFPNLAPDQCVAGSFQVRLLDASEEPEHAVPRLDGLHFVLAMCNGVGTIHTFVCVAGRVAAVPAPVIITDDLIHLEEACEQRVQNV